LLNAGGSPPGNASASQYNGGTLAPFWHPGKKAHIPAARWRAVAEAVFHTEDGSMTTAPLARTPLYDWHAAHGARLVEFGGWSMPVQYSSIVAEHNATRQAIGLFDISHMGRLRFDGPDAARFLDGLVTRRVLDMQPGQVRYGLVTNNEGGILDDVLVYRLADAAGGTYHLMVVNASNRPKIVDWIENQRRQQSPALDVEMSDLTTVWSMIAVQGPKALQALARLVEADLPSMKYYTGLETRICGHGGIVSRTGYTGEDGCELIVGANMAEQVWQQVLDAGQPLGALPAGLGCRDTLRLEAAMPLYGHELSEQINPYQAGLGFAVNLNDRTFPGRDALAVLKQDTDQPRRIGIELMGKRIPREGAAILVQSKNVGHVTSGTFSPTLEQPIAMGYVRPDAAMVGTAVEVDIRGRTEPGRIVALPFYRR
jgi:aminomethyltransferase